MGLNRQAKVLSKNQIEVSLLLVSKSRNPIRNRLIFLLSVRAGMRAKEIAGLKWTMLVDAQDQLSDEICLLDEASKGKSGRVIPMSKDLKAAIIEWRSSDRPYPKSDYVITTERASRTSPQAIVNLFAGWYRDLGFVGASSHSGRRTAITNWARKISSVGGSLRDVQVLAGHSALTTTQRYIEAHADAQRKVVEA